MELSRRAFLVGAGLSLLSPDEGRAQSRSDRDHSVEFDLPILSEVPTAVPIQVGVEHPMEPDHFIRSIDVSLDRDPVPYKGKFLFGPANGRAWVAFQMRSGAGGLVTATAECSRHGSFAGTKEVRVVDGGCTTAPENVARERIGNPVLRLPQSVKPGEIVEVRAK
ncbi:MAG: thiosulfate oxidation carrier protein SoxY, partial [Actinomycetota bacterium]